MAGRARVPDASIGTVSRRPDPADVYPWEVTPGVCMTGYNDRRSFGAYAWWVPRPEGGLLVDAPHWNRKVVDAMEARGGLAHVLLSHRDDVADAARYAEHFGAHVWIHEADRDAAPYATDVVTGIDEQRVAPGVVAFPVPGHTRGSVLYVVDDTWLFTGDSFAWSAEREVLYAFRGATWYSWDELRGVARPVRGVGAPLRVGLRRPRPLARAARGKPCTRRCRISSPACEHPDGE